MAAQNSNYSFHPGHPFERSYLFEHVYKFLFYAECIPAFLSKKDVIVQSPTGTGKTLAFVLPTVQLLLNEKRSWNKWQIGALVLLPNRELAVQVRDVIQPYADKVSLTVVLWSGGRPLSKDVAKFKEFGGNIVVATPGRLEALLTDSLSGFCLAGHLKSLEILILDEADRLLEMGFQKSLTRILASLPKQRRTGLFSATQVKEMEDLAKTGLRNPYRITVAPRSGTRDFAEPTPDSLKNYYKVVSADKKWAALIQFLDSHRKSKILVFFSTCACVDYFSRFLVSYLKKNQRILVLHGKKKRKRQKIFDQFRELKRGIMICTDIMSRGIHIPDIDWVIQYDPPRQASWFVHRSGRTGRCERAGKALALLTPSEEGYVEFLRENQKVHLEQMNSLEDTSEEFAEEIRLKMIEMAVADRDFLERGSKAFVSYIQSYSKHDCHLVCRLNELDVCGVGHSFGLLRLPRMPELAKRDLGSFKRSEVNTADIKYKNEGREVNRRSLLEEKKKEASSRKSGTGKKDLSPRKPQKRGNGPSLEELEDLAEDTRLMKKLKKGKISKTDFDAKFMKD